MTPDQVSSQLAAIESDEELTEQARELTQAWRESGIGSCAVEPVLRFMEQRPTWDFGSPGDLVHFVEEFSGDGYERELMGSFKRRPTAHTAWMIHRVANGESNSGRRAEYIKLLLNARANSDIDSAVSQMIGMLLEQ